MATSTRTPSRRSACTGPKYGMRNAAIVTKAAVADRNSANALPVSETTTDCYWDPRCKRNGPHPRLSLEGAQAEPTKLYSSYQCRIRGDRVGGCRGFRGSCSTGLGCGAVCNPAVLR